MRCLQATVLTARAESHFGQLLPDTKLRPKSPSCPLATFTRISDTALFVAQIVSPWFMHGPGLELETQESMSYRNSSHLASETGSIPAHLCDLEPPLLIKIPPLLLDPGRLGRIGRKAYDGILGAACVSCRDLSFEL